jgi:pyruvate ferredoxin oxidoreductase gamma subunit
MADYTEIRWHGRAQQGIVTAAKVLGEAALRMGMYVQAFPEFGPERMGAPIKAYNRVSDEPIRLHSQVAHPRIVLVVDPTLIGTVDIREGTPEDAIFIVNTHSPVNEMRNLIGLTNAKTEVYTVDASKISIESIGRHIPNTPMLGALAKVSSVVEISALLDDFKENYSKKYSQKVIEGNLVAMRRGFEEVKGKK